MYYKKDEIVGHLNGVDLEKKEDKKLFSTIKEWYKGNEYFRIITYIMILYVVFVGMYMLSKSGILLSLGLGENYNSLISGAGAIFSAFYVLVILYFMFINGIYLMEEEGEGFIKSIISSVMYGLGAVILPITMLWALVYSLYKDITTDREKEQKEKVREDINKIFNLYEEGNEFRYLNKVVELPNGYITYLNNVLYSGGKGIRFTTDCEAISKHDKENRGKILVAEGIQINDSNAEDYINGLVEDYINAKKYEEELEKYNQLVKQEEERLNDIQLINENWELNSKKREEVSGVLRHNFRSNQYEERIQEANKAILAQKEKLEELSKKVRNK